MSKRWVFESPVCTPEHPEANRIAERVSACQTNSCCHNRQERPKGRSEKTFNELQKYTTPQYWKGKGRLLMTKIVTPMKPAKGKLHQEAILQDKESRKLRK